MIVFFWEVIYVTWNHHKINCWCINKILKLINVHKSSFTWLFLNSWLGGEVVYDIGFVACRQQHLAWSHGDGHDRSSFYPLREACIKAKGETFFSPKSWILNFNFSELYTWFWCGVASQCIAWYETWFTSHDFKDENM